MLNIHKLTRNTNTIDKEYNNMIDLHWDLVNEYLQISREIERHSNGLADSAYLIKSGHATTEQIHNHDAWSDVVDDLYAERDEIIKKLREVDAQKALERRRLSQAVYPTTRVEKIRFKISRRLMDHAAQVNRRVIGCSNLTIIRANNAQAERIRMIARWIHA